MRRVPKPYLLFLLVFLLLLSLPRSKTEALRGAFVALSTPYWSFLGSIKQWAMDPLPHRSSLQRGERQEEMAALQIENQALRDEVKCLQELLQEEWILESQQLQCNRLLSQLEEIPNTFLQRRKEELSHLLHLQAYALPARVIFREAGAWSSALWINVGQEHNCQWGEERICVKSPVVLGMALIGIVDYVGKKQSRVRLVTDSGLTPSVRACRGFPQDLRLHEAVDVLFKELSLQREKSLPLLQQLADFRKTLPLFSPIEGYYAKGELHGSSLPLWRSRSELLKGVGFNMDFPDEEGPSRDLRSGVPYENLQGAPQEIKNACLLQVHDLLITTGMDGVFPPGLRVAQVTHIDLLREGSPSYELLAKPVAPSLDALAIVFVLPPVGYDPADRP